MIDIADFTQPGSDVLKNKLNITNGLKLANAEGDFAAARLAELHVRPIVGAFTTEHLQSIHAHVFQDVYEWAGQLRQINLADRLTRSGAPPWEVEKALDRVFDKLSAENHLKGYELDEWADRSSYYLGELATIQPFLVGNELVIREFATELGRENDIRLQWDGITKEQIADELNASFQASRQANMRRLLILAVDPEPLTKHKSHEFIRNRDRGRGRDMDLAKF